ncbi:hypothetical protein [Robertmurraya andreesenii]|uniref:Cytosolic protein n=1 Tax=Anoxybacillus andreesenii TaxID=1325932 RepID=A0ABT9V2X8_9BACL|nr:hypothetical protein [Robertmurraya andreesenii]MDQ0155308.1 hypothetical protein [Robertmurraya andreesenii]
MNDEEKTVYTDFSNVEVQKNFLTAEEFPEGAYGSPIHANDPVQNKETPWKAGQQFYSNFTYENRSLHEDLPRQMAGAHPTHDEKGKNSDPFADPSKTAQEK